MSATPFLTPVFLFGSLRSESGKSSILAHSAVYLHSQGKRIAVIDADAVFQHKLRNAFPRMVTLECYADIAEIAIEGTSRFRRTFFFTPVDRIAFFPAFKVNDLSKLLTDAALGDFFLQLRTQFDVVMINLPTGTEAFADAENFIQHRGRECGNPIALLVTNTDIKSLLLLDRLLRNKPALSYLARERLVFLYNRLPRGIEDSTIDNPRLDWSETKRVFNLPIAVGFNEMDDFLKQASEATPLVLKEGSKLHRAVSTLVRILFETANGFRQSEPEVTNPDELFPTNDPQILDKLSSHIEPLCRRIAACLYSPGISSTGFIESNHLQYRIRIRLSKIGRHIFPPILEVNHKTPICETQARLAENFANTARPIEPQSDFLKRERRPQIQVRGLYRFDDRFASSCSFELCVKNYYIYSYILAEPRSEEWKHGLPSDIPTLMYMLGYIKSRHHLIEPLEKHQAYDLQAAQPERPTTFDLALGNPTPTALPYISEQSTAERTIALHFSEIPSLGAMLPRERVFARKSDIRMPVERDQKFLHWEILAGNDIAELTVEHYIPDNCSKRFTNTPAIAVKAINLSDRFSQIPTIERPVQRFIKQIALSHINDVTTDFSNVIFDFKPSDGWYFTQSDFSKTPAGLDLLRVQRFDFSLCSLNEAIQFLGTSRKPQKYFELTYGFSDHYKPVDDDSKSFIFASATYKTYLGKSVSEIKNELIGYAFNETFSLPSKFATPLLLLEQSLPKVGWKGFSYNNEAAEEGKVERLETCFASTPLEQALEYRNILSSVSLSIKRPPQISKFQLKASSLYLALRFISFSQEEPNPKKQIRSIFPAECKHEKITTYIEGYENAFKSFTIAKAERSSLLRLLKIPSPILRRNQSETWLAAGVCSRQNLRPRAIVETNKANQWHLYGFDNTTFQIVYPYASRLKQVFLNAQDCTNNIDTNIKIQFSDDAVLKVKDGVKPSREANFTFYGYQPMDSWFLDIAKPYRFLSVWPLTLKFYGMTEPVESGGDWFFIESPQSRSKSLEYLPAKLTKSPFYTLYADIDICHLRKSIVIKTDIFTPKILPYPCESASGIRLKERNTITAVSKHIKQNFSVRYRLYAPKILYSRKELEFQKFSGIDLLFQHLSDLCRRHLYGGIEHNKIKKHNIDVENKNHFDCKIAYRQGVVDFRKSLKEDIPKKISKKIERKERNVFSCVQDLREAIRITQTSLARIAPEKSNEPV